MLDLKRYFRLYPIGVCHVEKKDSGFVAMTKRFDNETGAELSPEPQYFTIAEIEKEKQSFLDQLSAIDIIEKEIENL